MLTLEELKASFIDGVQAGAQSFVASPFTVATILIQTGYEPAAEVMAKDWFGRTVFKRAGMIDYIRSIYQKDGWRGLFRGATARFGQSVVDYVARDIAQSVLRPIINPPGQKKTANKSEFVSLAHNLAFDVVCNSAAMLVSHPLHVIGVRLAAQHVAGETVYTNVFQGLVRITREEGVAGLYAGLVPHLIAEASFVVSMGLITFAFTKLNFPSASMLGLESEPEKKKRSTLGFFRHALSSPIAQYFFYPFRLVTVVMAVNGARGLAVSSYPWMPHFDSWVDAIQHFYHVDGFGPRGLLRGSANLFRSYKRHIPVVAYKVL